MLSGILYTERKKACVGAGRIELISDLTPAKVQQKEIVKTVSTEESEKKRIRREVLVEV
jgi:hypothetical protein